MPPLAAPSGDMVVNHARLLGSAGRRRDLEAGLAAMQPGDVVPSDEVLFVPHIRATAKLSDKLPPSLFAARLTDQLRRVAGEALVDPVGHCDGARGLRFRSFASYAAWLLASWLTQPAPISTPLLRAALNGQSVETWQRRTLLVKGRQLAKVVRLLAAQGLASAWVQRLAPQDLILIAASLAHDYALGGFEAVVGAAAGSEQAAVASAKQVRIPDNLEISASARLRSTARTLDSLWTMRKAVQAGGNDFAPLAPAARIILGALLGLSEKPNLLQVLAPEDWTELALVNQPVIVSEGPSASTAQPVADHHVSPEHRPPQQSQTSPESPEAHLDEEVYRSEPESGEPPASQPTPAPDFDPPIAASVKPPVPASEAAAIFAPQPQRQSFRTDYGGLLFLINVLIWMGLYPDFTRPLDKGLEPSPFWLLAGLGRFLFGRRFARDPLYRWLLENGRDGPLPRTWRTDPAWLAGIAAPPPSAPRSRKWSRKPSQEYRRSAVRKGNDPWLSSLADFLTFRLAHSAERFTLRQLCLPAQLTIQDDEIVVHFCLNELPMPLRMAGLDRNPGWLPAEGRNLFFEFA